MSRAKGAQTEDVVHGERGALVSTQDADQSDGQRTKKEIGINYHVQILKPCY